RHGFISFVIQRRELPAICVNLGARRPEKYGNSARALIGNKCDRPHRIHRRRENADVVVHAAPPLTGGINASSSPSFRTVSPVTYSRFTATADRDSPLQSIGNFAASISSADATVAFAGNSS